jgi:pyruvate formate lyase activating enzyme
MDFPIKGFLETSFVDWPGKIASVLFLPHCNFRCPYCHNHELVTDPGRFPTVPLHHILETLRHYRGWIDGVCITGGEPTLLPELPGLIERIRQERMLIKLDTNGSHPHVLEHLINARLVDYVAMDVKAPLDRESYVRCSGVAGDLSKIVESVNLLKASHLPYEFRVTVAPTFLIEEDLMRMAHQLKGAKKFTLQQFSPAHTLDPGCRAIVPYPEGRIRAMQEGVNSILKQDFAADRHDACAYLQAS